MSNLKNDELLSQNFDLKNLVDNKNFLPSNYWNNVCWSIGFV